MTPADREQQALEFTEVLLGNEVCLSDGECDIVQRETVKLLADTERATLERVMNRFAATAGLVQWCKQQIKEGA